MNQFNGFRLLQYLCGGLTQWILLLGGGYYLLSACTSIGAPHFCFDAAMTAVCLLGCFATLICHEFFYICADGHDIMINESQNQE